MRAVFIRVVEEQDKQTAVRGLVHARGSSGSWFELAAQSFRAIPGSPFSYWVSERLRRCFQLSAPYESGPRIVRQGLATADDFRFVRTWWAKPVPIERWVPFTKGGSFARYYRDVSLVVNWSYDGRELASFQLPGTSKAAARVQNADHYFKPGLTWPLRGATLSAQVVPLGCIFSIAGRVPGSGGK